MKILHCSDIHLGRRPTGPICNYSSKRFLDYFIAFEDAINIAIEKNAEVFLISGDLFDKKDLTPDILEKTEKLFERLRNNRITVIAIEGNHDKIVSYDTSWLIYLKNRGYIKIPTFSYKEDEDRYIFSPVTINNVRFYGLGYSGTTLEKHIDDLAGQLEENSVNIVMAHTAVSSELFFSGLTESRNIDKLKYLVKYIAGGHIHKKTSYPEGSPFFFTPGSTEYWDLDDKGKKGVILFDTEKNDTEFIETKKRNVKNLKPFTYKAGSEESFREDFLQHIGSIQISEGEDIVLLTIISDDSIYIDTGWCQEQIEKAGALKAKVSVSYTVNHSDTNLIEMSDVEMTEFDHIIKWESFGNKAGECLKALQRIKKNQTEGNYEEFRNEFDSFLNSLSCGGIDADKQD